MGEEDTRQDSVPREADPEHPSKEVLPTPVYFPVTPLKLVAISVCTFGLYELFWFYKNWRLIKEREKLHIRPFWRAFFAYFFCYSCFKRIQDTGKSLNLDRSIAPLALAVLWIIVWLLYLLPGLYFFLSSFSVLALLPVQALAKDINEALRPGHNPNARFTAWNMACVVIGTTCLVILLLNWESIPQGTGF